MLKKLQDRLKELNKVAISFSGGIDSSFLLYVARITLPTENVLAIIANGNMVPRKDYEEAIEFLKGNMQPDVKEVILALGSYMIKLARKGNNIEENKQKMLEQIQNGQAFAKLEQWIQKQGGDISYLENTEKFEKAKFVVPVISNRSGYVKELLAQEIGKASMNLGAGRKKKEDNIDFSVGIVLEKKIGDKVENRDILAYVHANDEKLGNEIAKDVLNAYTITNEIVSKKQDILKIV